MKLEIWADFCDPFSCLGVKTLRAAMAQLGVEKFFEIEMKSYETSPPGRAGQTSSGELDGELWLY